MCVRACAYVCVRVRTCACVRVRTCAYVDVSVPAVLDFQPDDTLPFVHLFVSMWLSAASKQASQKHPTCQRA